ncbi:hypothetical protein [Massilia brevitalea]|uniref:hypothetical protein n=1 Tax=Massilia brevitalea TaxID=442526 RepID=UPI00273A47C6|nr:hypothetical protein [Massilia brevitalea]
MYPLLDDAGRIAYVAACFTECTELKRVEDSLLKSEERLRLAMQGSTDAPWDWGTETGLVHYSDRWWEMLGFPPSHGERDPVAWRTQMHPGDNRPERRQGSRAPHPRPGLLRPPYRAAEPPPAGRRAVPDPAAQRA